MLSGQLNCCKHSCRAEAGLFCSGSAAGAGSHVPGGLRSGVSCGSRLAARGWRREQRLSPGLRRCRAAPTAATARAGGRPLLGAPHPQRWEGAGQAAAVPGSRLAASRGRARPVPSRTVSASSQPALAAALIAGGRSRSRPLAVPPPAPASAFPWRPPGVSFLRSSVQGAARPRLRRAFLPAIAPRSLLPGHARPGARGGRSLLCFVPNSASAFLSPSSPSSPPTPASPLPIPSPAPASTLDGSPLPRPRSFHTSSHSSHSSLPRFKLQGK